LIAERLLVTKQVRMWRMALIRDQFPGNATRSVKRLKTADLDAIDGLTALELDRPDAFVPEQLDTGVFFGHFEGGRLLSMAGTHVLSERMDVAAVGNVYTAPSVRGRGLAKLVSSAVIAELLSVGIGTIVLNVAMENGPALSVYESLGFYPHCGYYEGFGELRARQPDHHNATEKL
jgi:predicted GNAT family acetyltransferase